MPTAGNRRLSTGMRKNQGGKNTAFKVWLEAILFCQGGIISNGHHFYLIKACGDYSVATTKNYIEILNFRHFFNHFVFTNEGDKIRNKQLKKYINVFVVIDMECGDTTE
ncbi:MAG: hypothetical protein K0R31_87 [Clostridiales bacterium]|jgi:hypothetical protein|nr:hypothetical protein [Clostridiales bacterium]MDF2987441.1 hypothetical protein [Eubacterium sp.]